MQFLHSNVDTFSCGSGTAFVTAICHILLGLVFAKTDDSICAGDQKSAFWDLKKRRTQFQFLP